MRLMLILGVLLAGCDDQGGGAAQPDAALGGDAAAARDGMAPRDGDARDARVTDAHLADARVDARIPGADAAPPDAALDAGPSEDAGGPPVAPLEAPPRTWTWLPIEGMRCADGSPTGIGVNFAPGATRMFIYLIGGGACWDEASCYADGRAAFIESGFGAADFAGLNLDSVWFMSRSAPENPFADHHLVFVPYCTGDIHGGNRVARYGAHTTHHVGAVNFEALARRLHATFPDLERVVVAGGSAGGFGALLNWHRAQTLFAGARVDMVDDAGAAIPGPEFPAARRTQWNTAWNFAATLPADCPACLMDWAQLVPYGLAHGPGARAALLTAVADGVIADYIGINGATMQRGVTRLVAGLAAPGFGAFLVPGDAHVLMGAPVVAGGQTVPQWLRAMQADDPAWGTVGPTPFGDCGALADCGQCAVCAAQDPCAAQFAPCDRLGGCVDTVICALACRADDVACIATCAAPHPGVGEAALALYQCVRCDTCGAACGQCP